MTDAEDEVVVERLPADEAFDLVGHEIRLGILVALDEADGPLTFTELRERVGTRDSGQFNYHLDKLTDRFVDAPEEGYVLADPGRRVTGAIRSGGITKTLDADPVPVEGVCLHCGGNLEARFRDLNVRIACTECGFKITNPQIPPGILEGYSPADAAAVVDRWMKSGLHVVEYGFCEYCGGRMESTVVPIDDTETEDDTERDFDVVARYECARCGTSITGIVGVSLLTHPAVVAFHYEHGIDVREVPFWQLDWLELGSATVIDDDPLRVEVPITLEDETLTLVVDESEDVVEERRT